MNDEQQDPLWDLLGKVREPKPSPFFASKVMRAIHEEKQEKDGLFAWLRRQWLIPVSCTATAAIALYFTISPSQPSPTQNSAHNSTHNPDPVEEMAVTVAENVDVQDSQVIADLDELIAYEDTSSLWLDTDSISDY